MYHARLDNFEGPLHLLVKLIDQSKLDITDIALAQVTEQYLDYVRSLAEIDPLELGRFTEIAARLIYIKSQALLPDHTPEVDQASAELQEQLAEYRRYQEAAVSLEQRLKQAQRSFERPASRAPHIPSSPPSLTSDMLAAAFTAALAKVEATPPSSVVASQIRFEDVFDRLSLLCRQQAQTQLSQLLQTASSRLEVVLLFLALLELNRLRQVSLCQETVFGDIIIINEPEP